MKRITLLILLALLALGTVMGAPVRALELQPKRDEPSALTKGQAVEDQLLVKFKSAPTITYESAIALTIPFTRTRLTLREAGFAVRGNRSATNVTKKLKVKAMRVLGQSDPGKEIALVQLPAGGDEQGAIEQYKKTSGVEFAEPNYLVSGLSLPNVFLPNDPYFQRTAGQDYQWNLYAIRMPEAWYIPPQGGSPSVKVAVIDSGVAFATHTVHEQQFVQAPELAGVNFVAPKRFESLSGDCTTPLPVPIVDDHPHDQSGHGTHVTATIVQATNNAQHAAGIAFNTSIIPIKVLTACTSGTFAGESLGTISDIIAGINHAVGNGADVINLSLGMDQDSFALHNAITSSVNAGVTVVAATGNSATRTLSQPIMFPAAYPEVIAVGASRFDGKRADYSQYGPELDLVAPGGQNEADQFDDSVIQCLIDAGVDFNAGIHCIFPDQNNDLLPDGIVQQTIIPSQPTQFTSVVPSTIPGFTTDMKCIHADIVGQAVFVSVDQSCGLYNGTSMAAPHVAATAALILSVNSNLTPAQVKDILTATASKTAIPSYTQTEHGAGLLDANAALIAASGGTITPPVSTPTPTPNKLACAANSDCGCALDIDTNQCAIENNQWLTGQCTAPDFCSGITGTCAPGCVNNTCQLVCPGPTATPQGISWNTKTLSFQSDSLVIVANGQTFTAPVTGVTVHSDPGGPTYTTLEATWFDAGTEMRLNMYVKADANRWWVTEARTYGGADPGKWVYYTDGTTLAPFTATLGSTLTLPNVVMTSDAGHPDTGTVTMANVSLKTKLGTTSEPFQLLVGDVNDTNTITIEDVSAVLSKYSDFKVPVPDGTPEDVNADGFLTIEDVALVLLNYLDFTIPGEQP